MIHDQQLLEKFRALPEDKQSEVIDFIEFLNSKTTIKSPPESKASNQRNLRGALKGKIWMSDDFDEPLEDFKDYM